jgi:hypothetical protein
VSEFIGQFVICRSRDQGVVCGYLEKLVPCEGLFAAELTEARQVRNWTDGANTLFEMALTGPGQARISLPLDRFMMAGVCGVYPCTPEATENLRQSRWGKRFAPSGSPRRATKTPG